MLNWGRGFCITAFKFMGHITKCKYHWCSRFPAGCRYLRNELSECIGMWNKNDSFQSKV